MKPLVFCILVSLVLLSRSGAESSSKSLSLCDLADLAGWEGLVPDSTLDYEGMPAPKWEHARFSAAQTDRIPHDWTDFNCLEFALHSAKATGGAFMVILGSDTPDTDGPDYFSLRIKLDWTGWKEFVVLFSEMGRSRGPVGWHKIDSILFAAQGWGNEPNPESVVNIANLRLINRDAPGISDEELFDILDLDYPGLEKVKAAIESSDVDAAKHEFAEYLRGREKPLWHFDWRARPRHESRPDGVDTGKADRILARDLPSVGVYHKFEGEIDWTLNPINYREWPWQLNRHPFWVTLGRAYWATGEEKYAKEFVFQMLDWVKKCPVPRHASGNSSETWRTIEAGIRTGHQWPEAYHLFLTSPSFTDEAIITMVKSFVEHARHLMKWPTGGNWLAMESNGLMHVGVLFPEFREAAQWRKTATDRLYVELDRQVYPDGAQIELSTGYHQVSLGNFLKAWGIAHLNDRPMPDDYIAKLAKMYDYNLLASMPGGFLPGLNDAGRTDVKPHLEQASKFFPERKDYEWVATQGKRGEKPSVRSTALPFAGQLVMRSGWEKDDLYLLMDAGPFGYGHQHEDKLSIVIYAHGKYHLVDPGNYPYDSSEWRKYVLSTRAHNTIMVDGLDQRRRGKRVQYVVSKPLSNKWVAGQGFDYASGTYAEGYGPRSQVEVTHTRHVFFANPEYWIVTDFLTPSDGKPHRYESMFHLDADGVTVDERRTSLVTDNKESSNIAIIPLADENLGVRIVSGQEKPVVQGWVPAGGYRVRPIPTPVFEKKQAGPASFVYVLYPISAGTECPIAEIAPLPIEAEANVQVVGATIRFANGRTDYFVQADRPGTKIKFLDFETDAAATLVRIEGERVTAACLAGGTGLIRAGEPIPAEVREIKDLSQTDVRHTF